MPSRQPKAATRRQHAISAAYPFVRKGALQQRGVHGRWGLARRRVDVGAGAEDRAECREHDRQRQHVDADEAMSATARIGWLPYVEVPDCREP